MPTFRYYLLDSNSSILTADFLDSNDLNAAIVETHGLSRSAVASRVRGFEIWQDSQLLHRETWTSETG